MTRAVLIGVGWYFASFFASGVYIAVLAGVFGHRSEPMGVALALEAVTFLAGAFVSFNVGRKAQPQGAGPIVLLLAYLAATVVGGIPMFIATALAFDH